MIKLVSLLFFVVFVSNTQAASKIVLATDPWCPYICSADSDKPGFLIEVVKAALAESGYIVDFETINWARSIEQVRSGRIDGLVGTYKSDAPDFYYGQQHITLSEMCFFTQMDDDWRYNEPASLKSRTTLLVNGYSYGDKLDAYIAKNSKQGLRNMMFIAGKETMARRFQILQSSRANTLLEDKWVITEALKQQSEPLNLKIAGCLAAEKVYVGFSPNKATSPRLARALDKGIIELTKSGQLANIIANYM